MNAKSDAEVCGIDPAVESERHAANGRLCRRLETDSSGRESAVIVRSNGIAGTLSADIVVVSCGAINSAALLLRSANEQHPRGLANTPTSSAGITWVTSIPCLMAFQMPEPDDVSEDRFGQRLLLRRAGSTSRWAIFLRR